MVGHFIDATDLELLQRALDARCRHLNIDPESAEALMIASRLIDLYQRGVRDEQDLVTHPIAMEILRREA